jgi:hypothetical protein
VNRTDPFTEKGSTLASMAWRSSRREADSPAGYVVFDEHRLAVYEKFRVQEGLEASSDASAMAICLSSAARLQIFWIVD